MDSEPVRQPMERIGRRLVIGLDLLDIKENFDLGLLESTYLFALNSANFYRHTNPQNQGEPVRSVSRCLLVRMITDWSASGKTFPLDPDVFNWPMPFVRVVDPQHYIDMLTDQYLSVVQRHWPGYSAPDAGVLLGISNKNAVDRWVVGRVPGDHTTPHPIVQRVMTLLVADIRVRGETALEEHVRRVEVEAMARGHLGIDPLLSNARWNSTDKALKILEQAKTRKARRKKG